MKARAHRPIVALACLAVLALASPILRAQIQFFGEVDRHLYRGTVLLQRGQEEEAEREWILAARLAPYSPTAHHALGSLYLAKGRWSEARTELHRLADLDPSEPHVLCVLAERELNSATLPLLELAAVDAARAAILEPMCRRAQLTAANAWLAKGDSRRGIEYLRRVVLMEPEHPAVALRLGRLLLRNQRLSEATEAADQLVRRYPGMSEALSLQGACYRQHPPGSVQATSAESTLLRALQLDPLNGEAHAALGLLQAADGRPGDACRYLEAARLLKVRDLAVLFNLGKGYRSLGRLAEAGKVEAEFARRSSQETEIAALEKRLAVSPRDRETLARLIQLTSEADDPERRDRYLRLAGDSATQPREVAQ